MTRNDTHTSAPAVPDPDLATSIARALGECEAHEQRAAALRPANKAALFDALVAARITTVTVTFDGYGDSGQIAAAIEQLCYDCPQQSHPGWENNDGTFGDFVFDVAARTITLDHNERYTATQAYSHEF
ncbi:DUF6878 family protein [Paracoccus shandongensis]|uniref:DUF6878 family protein n=1 Tax=Paracoccus shandongensis TaxID=2816048 RepID=UPI001A8FC791|nr:DUF6878 family protein [Paracoccus shandongensis]